MNDFNNLCKSCMSEIEDLEVCPKCGYNQSEKQGSPYLQKGTILEDRYYIGKKIDQNGEGIGYVAFDSTSKCSVYIREFFLLNHVTRPKNKIIIARGSKDTYNKYKEEFLRYFRSMAKFRGFSAFVPIYDIFTANNTAYVVHEWIEGVTLDKFILRNGGLISWDMARPLFMPIISALGKMYKSGLSHLGICPENLIITNSGKMKLVGFSIPQLRMSNPDITFQPYDGCTAIEQYEVGGKTDENSDVYAVAACIFFALTGKYPQSAPKRKEDDKLLIATSVLRSIPPYVIAAIANALQIPPTSRTASFERFREEISDAPTVANYIEDENVPEEEGAIAKKRLSDAALAMISFGIALFILVLSGAIFVLGDNFNRTVPSSNIASNPGLNGYESTSALDNFNRQNLVIVPDFIGEKYETIQKELINSNDYKILRASEEFDDIIEIGTIISQTPKAGQEIEKGSDIIVILSKGPMLKELPIIAGLNLSEASMKLSAQGFTPEELKEYNNTVSAGYIIGYKSNNPGDKIKHGSKVAIIVSQGKKR